ncbi:MAG: Rid family detoxifying hydrolase [Polyangiales bacterium]
MDRQKITPIVAEDAPKPAAAYSQAVTVDGWLYCSGQIAMDPNTGEMVPNADIVAQTTQVMSNLQAVLRAAGCDFHDVVKVTVFLTDMSEFSKMNEVYSRFINLSVPPARACVAVAALPRNASVEIELVAKLR